MITHNLLYMRCCLQNLSATVQSQNNGQLSERVLFQVYALLYNLFSSEVQADRATPVASSPAGCQVLFPPARSGTSLTRVYRNSITFNQPISTHSYNLCPEMEKALMI